MRLKTKRPMNLVLLLLLIGLTGSVFAGDLTFSGDMTGATSYLWRGVKQYDGPALQGTASGAFKAVSFGVWFSTVNFGPGTPALEADPFVEFSLPTGALETSLGATVYTYDFKEYNAGADFEYELFAKIGFGPLGLAAFFIPSQGSTEGEANEAPYWVELSATKTALSADWGILYGMGTYSSRFLSTPKKKPASHLVLSARKNLSETLSVSWNYSIAVDSDLDDNLWATIGLSF